MFDIRRQEERIAEVKARVNAERQSAALQLRAIMPRARRAAAVGSVAWAARKALPLLQPVAFGLARRAVGHFNGKRAAAIVGIAGLAVGAWRLLRSDSSDGD